MSHSINGHFTPASLLKFAAPSIIMMMFMSLYTIIDGIFISRFVGSNALSSLNIVYPIINIVFAIGTMLGTGGNAIISRYMGEGKDKEAKECMTQFVVISLLISVVILVLTHMNLTSISRILGASDLLLADCDSYLSVVVSFAPAAILQCLFQSYFVTAGRPNLGLVLTMIAGIRFGLCFYRCLPDGHQRSCPCHRYRSIHSGYRRPAVFYIFERFSAFHPFQTPSQGAWTGLL